MASNGSVDTLNNHYFQPGSGTWADLTSGWSAYNSWSINPVELIYETTVTRSRCEKTSHTNC